MNLDIILKLLYANNLQSIVTRAVQLEQNIPFKHHIGEEVIVELADSDMRKVGRKFVGRGYGGVKCEIIGIDNMDIERPYIVRMPDMSSKKYAEDSFSKIDTVRETEEYVAPETSTVPQ